MSTRTPYQVALNAKMIHDDNVDYYNIYEDVINYLKSSKEEDGSPAYFLQYPNINLTGTGKPIGHYSSENEDYETLIVRKTVVFERPEEVYESKKVYAYKKTEVRFDDLDCLGAVEKHHYLYGPNSVGEHRVMQHFNSNFKSIGGVINKSKKRRTSKNKRIKRNGRCRRNERSRRH